MAAYTDPFFDDVNYKGAFDEYSSDNLDALWVRGWTHLWERAMTPYICADYNYDDVVNLIDILFYIDWKYKGGRMPQPLLAADVNSDGSENLLDILYLVDYKYKNGNPPNCPTAP